MRSSIKASDVSRLCIWHEKIWHEKPASHENASISRQMTEQNVAFAEAHIRVTARAIRERAKRTPEKATRSAGGAD